MDVATAISVLEAQVSRFEPSFSENERFSALNDVCKLILSVERELQEMDASGDVFTQARAQQLRRRFQSALQQLARAGVSVPIPTQHEGVTL